MKFLLGKKLEMTQLFAENGRVTPVTKVTAGPCTVLQVKTSDTDGYCAVQFGYGRRRAKNVRKPQTGHVRRALGQKTDELPRYVRELRLPDDAAADMKPGDVVDVSNFQVGDSVTVTGTAKGKGFQGVVKRHGFHGSPASHGHKDQLRMPGSIGATGPAHVFKGTRMGGRMGGGRVTVAHLEVMEVEPERNTLYLKGAVPGARNGLLLIRAEGEMTASEQKISESPTVDSTSDDEAAEGEKQENKETKKQIENGPDTENTQPAAEASGSENTVAQLKSEQQIVNSEPDGGPAQDKTPSAESANKETKEQAEADAKVNSKQ